MSTLTTPTGTVGVRSRRSRSRLALTAATASLFGVVALAPAGAAPAPTASSTVTSAATAGASASCSITWGSLPKTSSKASTGTVDAVRSGRHACFDRLVIDLDDVSHAAGYDVRYVSSIKGIGSGKVIPVTGGAKLQVTVNSPAYDANGNPTYVPADPLKVVKVSGYDTFRQVVWAGSFEGQTQFGMGVRARLPFRTFILDGPGDGARLVIDVGHRW